MVAIGIASGVIVFIVCVLRVKSGKLTRRFAILCPIILSSIYVVISIVKYGFYLPALIAFIVTACVSIIILSILFLYTKDIFISPKDIHDPAKVEKKKLQLKQQVALDLVKRVESNRFIRSPKKKIKYLEKASGFDSANPRVHFLLSKEYFDSNKPDLARIEIGRAIELAPDVAEYEEFGERLMMNDYGLRQIE